MKKVIIYLVLILVLLSLTACSSIEPLIGTWELVYMRVAGDTIPIKGTILEIDKNGNCVLTEKGTERKGMVEKDGSEYRMKMDDGRAHTITSVAEISFTMDGMSIFEKR